jgi:membrane protease YdiL (CAAX protease family)
VNEPNDQLEDADDDSSGRGTIILLAVVVEGGLVGMAIALGWLLDREPFARLRLSVVDALWGLLAAVPLGLFFVAMIRWPVGPLRGLKTFTDTVIRPMLAPCTTVDLFGISVLAGVGEEALFRGLLQDTLAVWMPLALALTLASLLFGILHAVTPTYAVLAGLMGAYLGGLYEWTGGLLAPMVAHGVYDFGVLLYLQYGPGSDQIPPSVAKEDDPAKED